MKIFTKFFKNETFEKLLDSVKHVDFSLFIDEIPKSQSDLSKINIMVLVEPDEYFGLHTWTIQNKGLFQVILTWSDKVINNCENAMFLPFGQTWFHPDQYEKDHTKEFQIAHLCGDLLKSYGHQMRHELLYREDEFKTATKFYKTIGNRHDLDDARIGKETVFGDSQYGIVIENFSHRGFFSEKLIDCFLLRTIPIYWGCSNIGDYFNTSGIIKIHNVDDMIWICNNLDPEAYIKNAIYIQDNYQRALKYINYENSVSQKIIEIFEHNNL